MVKLRTGNFSHLFFVIVLFIGHHVQSQNIIRGSIKSEKGQPILNANVLLLDSIKNILTYNYSNSEGKYELKYNKYGSLIIQFSALGYETRSKNVVLAVDNSLSYINITLKEKPTELKEIILNYERPIFQKKDTVTVRVENFTDGTESTVEQLLKKIPGLQVDASGTIKVGNQEIEKLMVDGDDLFERGYKILSKNMPAYPIEEIEILKNYSNNRLLKGVEASDKVALNLKLKEEAKRIWFGNTTLGLGNDGFYDLKGNLMNFGKKNKYYFLTNLNNVGYDATGDIIQLIRPFRPNEAGNLGDNQIVQNLIHLAPGQLGFDTQRTLFNNAELLSINAIFNPTEKLKIKTLGFFNWDETDFFRNSTNVVDFGQTNFTNIEDYQLRNKKQIAFGKVDLIYNISKSQMLETVTKYNRGHFEDGSNLSFNTTSTLESLKHDNHLFDQKLVYTHKYPNKNVLMINGRFIAESAPQTYRVNQFLYEDIFPEFSNSDRVEQQSEGNMVFYGLGGHWFNRRENNDLWELEIGGTYRKDRLYSSFSLFEGENLLSQPEGYENDLAYATSDFYLKSKYLKKINSVGITPKLALHQLANRLELIENTSTQTPFFINPSIGLDWEISDDNKITGTYSYNTSNATVIDVFDNFVLNGFRNFTRGTGDFNQLSNSSFVLNHQLGNWSKRFFANTFLLFGRNHDFFSTNSIVNQNVVQTEKILIQDQSFFNLSSKLDYYFRFISSNLKLDLSYTSSNFKNEVNNSGLRSVANRSFGYGLELRSGFQGIFNYHFGTKWNTNTIKTTITNEFTNNTSFLDVSFVFSEKWEAQLNSERYYFGNLKTDNTYYFLDLQSTYKLKKDKINLSLVGKNLFNTIRFRDFTLTDIGSATTEYRLLPRFLMLKVEYRF